MRFAYSIPDFRGFNRDFTRGTAEVRASWIRVAFATMVSALIQFILGGSATLPMLHLPRCRCLLLPVLRPLHRLPAPRTPAVGEEGAHLAGEETPCSTFSF